MSGVQPARVALLVALLVAVVLPVTGCAAPTLGMPSASVTTVDAAPSGAPSTASATTTSTPTRSATPTPGSVPTPTPVTTSAPATATPTTRTPTGPAPSDGRAVEAVLSIPAIGLSRLVVQPYEGWTDDAPGTAIQNRGRAASPNGTQGGTGAGGVGNYQVTAHRNSSTAAFARLPRLVDGDVVHVDAAGVRYTYRVTGTRQTSFRSEASLAEQRAAVPGRPGVAATEAMITLSTCATQEDHAAGNYWADEHENPEHRIDKIGVLVETGPVP